MSDSASTAHVEVSDTPNAAPGSPAPRTATNFRLRAFLYRYFLILILGALILGYSLASPTTFFTTGNFQTILGSQALLLVLSLGLTVAMATGEFDLSIGAVLSFAAVMTGWLTVNHGWPLWTALLAVLGLSGAIGVFHAIFVVRIGVTSFITTLGMGTFLSGIAILITNSATIPNIPQGLQNVATHQIFGLQLIFYYAIGIALVLWYVLEHTPLGRWMLFVGVASDVARLNGVAVGGIRAGGLITSALIAGLAGILQAGYLGAANPFLGQDYLLPAFAGVFLGATAIKPGRPNAWGTVIAIYVVITGIVGLEILTGATGWISNVFYGGTLVVAVAVSRIVAGRETSEAI